jgi:hypothetical protein
MTAAATDDHKIRLWENETGKVRRLLEGHRGPVLTIALAQGGKTLASAGQDGLILLWDVWAPLKKGLVRPEVLSAQERKALWKHLWSELGLTDVPRAYQAMCRLTTAGGQVVSGLQQQVQPILELQTRIQQLLADLDARKYAVRRRAAVELEKLGDLALPALEQALQGKPSVETRLRMEQLLRRLQRSDDDKDFSGRLQLLRSIEVLENIGTPEARKLLARMADRLPAPWGQREAKAAMERLGKQGTGKQ